MLPHAEDKKPYIGTAPGGSWCSQCGRQERTCYLYADGAGGGAHLRCLKIAKQRAPGGKLWRRKQMQMRKRATARRVATLAAAELGREPIYPLTAAERRARDGGLVAAA